MTLKGPRATTPPFSPRRARPLLARRCPQPHLTPSHSRRVCRHAERGTAPKHSLGAASASAQGTAGEEPRNCFTRQMHAERGSTFPTASTPPREGPGGSGPPTPHSSQAPAEGLSHLRPQRTGRWQQDQGAQQTCVGRWWPCGTGRANFRLAAVFGRKRAARRLPTPPAPPRLVCPPRAGASQAVLTPAPMWHPEPPCAPGALTQHPECPNHPPTPTL